MKTKIILSLTIGMLSFISVNAQRVLTDDERNTLIASVTFRDKCVAAVRRYADTWSKHDGAGLANTESARIKWAKDRQLSVGYIENGFNNFQQVAEIFVNASHAKTYTLSTAPQPEATLIAAWVTASSFDEFVITYFTVVGESIDFTIGN